MVNILNVVHLHCKYGLFCALLFLRIEQSPVGTEFQTQPPRWTLFTEWGKVVMCSRRFVFAKVRDRRKDSFTSFFFFSYLAHPGEAEDSLPKVY